MIWYLAYALAGWISVSLIFTAILGAIGYRWNKARELRAAKAESRWWLSRCVEHDLSELPPIIRTWQ